MTPFLRLTYFYDLSLNEDMIDIYENILQENPKHSSVLYYSVISSTYLSEKFFLKTKIFLGTFPKVEVLKAPTSTLLSCRWEGLWLLQMPNGASQQLDRGKEKCKSSPSFSSAFPNAKYVVVLGSYVHTMYIPNPLFLMQNMRVH